MFHDDSPTGVAYGRGAEAASMGLPLSQCPYADESDVCMAWQTGWKVWKALYDRHPMIVCLCGSTRFYDAFRQANYAETMAGKIVLSVGFYPHSQAQAHGETVGCTPEQKAMLDELHLRKIDLANEILVLNVGGYIGESTAREIEYAKATGKPVRYLED